MNILKTFFEKEIRDEFYSRGSSFLYVLEDNDNNFYLIYEIEDDDIYDIIAEVTYDELIEENISPQKFENFLISISDKYDLTLIFPSAVYYDGHLDYTR